MKRAWEREEGQRDVEGAWGRAGLLLEGAPGRGGGEKGPRMGNHGAETGTGGRGRLYRVTQGLAPSSVPSRWAGPEADAEAGSS